MRSPVGRIAIVAGTVVVLVVLFLVLRQGDDDESATETPTRVTTTTLTGRTTTSVTLTPVPATTEPSGPRRIRVTVSGGTVAGGVKRERVAQGERIVLVVRADVSDHVHVHGYDRFADVGPGAPAQLELRATIPGRFEVELEDRRLRILELEVRP